MLTTPVMSENDASCPGECWFLYWKTSPALWKQKIQNWPSSRPIFIPIAWGLHCSAPQVFDFGEHRAELDLCFLNDLLVQTQKEAYFLLPIGPMPFLPNGGIPSLYADCFAKSETGLDWHVVNEQKQLVHLYSFYGSGLFGGFKKFVWHLREQFEKSGQAPRILLSESFFIQNGDLISFFKDRSEQFYQGLAKFVQQRDGASEKEYEELIRELYVRCAQDGLGELVEDQLNFTYFGSAPADLFLRSQKPWTHWFSGHHPFESALYAYSAGTLPTFLLLHQTERPDSSQHFFKDFFAKGHLRALFEEYYDEDEQLEFTPVKKCLVDDLAIFKKSGAFQSFQRYFPWCFSQGHLECDEEDAHYRPVALIFSGLGQGTSVMGKALRYFLQSGSLLINKDILSEKDESDLASFLLTNQLEKRVIKKDLEIELLSLGDASVIFFSLSELQQQSNDQKKSFWDTLWRLFELDFLKIESTRPVLTRFFSRRPFSGELDFQDIRRLSFFNPSSYPLEVKVAQHKHFAFLKYVDEFKGEVKSQREGVQVRLGPGGHVALDYGHFL